MFMGMGNYEVAGTAIEGTSALDFSSGTASFVFEPMGPVEILRWGVTLTVALAGTDLIMTGTHRQLATAALTPVGTGDVGTVTATTTSGANIGDTIYTEDVNPNATFALAGGDRDSSGTETGINTKPFLVLGGEEVLFISDDGPSTCNGYVWVHYRRLPWQNATVRRQRADITAPTAAVGTTWLHQATKVAS